MALLLIFTFGIYSLYWFWRTQKELEEKYKVKLPHSILIIIPIANLYWLYKYCEIFSNKVKKDKSPLLWFLLFIFVPIIPPLIVQSEYNKIAR